MPNMDGTGPRGMGPLTGRGFGPCGKGYGRGFGAGRGFGRGMGWRAAFAPVYPVQQAPIYKEPTKEELEQEKAEIERELKEIKERLKSLEK